MPLSKCVRCEKLYNKIKSPVCPACMPDEDKDFDLVRETLSNNPNLNAEQVAELSGVNIECVLRMIQDGLISSIKSGTDVKCGRCGAPAISITKRLCQSCLDKLEKEVAKSRSKIQLGERKETQVGEYSNIRQTFTEKRRS